jgi:hypothetical protein
VRARTQLANEPLVGTGGVPPGTGPEPPFDRTPVLAHDSRVNPQRGPTVERPERPLPSVSSGSAPLRPHTGRDQRNTEPRRPPNTRPCAREGKSNNYRAFTYNHCVPRRTLQFHASPAATRHELEPALLPDERLRQLPRGRPDHRDGQLPDLRVHPPAPLTGEAPPIRAPRSRSARRSSRIRSSSCR